ncbi:hypothetical protein GF357_03370 [Candidatus Dojkabacteria bacterium]|nr:hypothetical protein [Candidatus Dojkabacteria bacterium]
MSDDKRKNNRSNNTKGASAKKTKNLKEAKYKVDGMHCPSCELAIEKKLLQEDGVELVDASVSKGEVYIQYSKSKPSLGHLRDLFKNKDYKFYAHKSCKCGNSKRQSSNACGAYRNSSPLFKMQGGKLLIDRENLRQYLYSFGAAGVLILIYYILQKTGVTSGFTVSENSALSMFVLFGIVAGLSSCAALVGGLVLSMSKQWSEMYKDDAGFGGKYTPHILFNFGRLLSFGVFGFMLGGLGSVIGVSFRASAFLAILVSILMIALGLQMLNIPYFKNIRFGLPKFLSRWAMKKDDIKSPWGPFVLGFVTFFLPCGFTVTAQSAALISGSAVRGSLITLAFALGTLPMLMFIGVTSSKLAANKHISGVFLKTVGILVVFFALYTFNSQLNLLGVPSLSDIKNISVFADEESVTDDLPPIDDEGNQVIEMSASASGYSPNYFKLRAGIPVKWIIRNDGVSGCTDAVISPDLFEGEVQIDKSEVIKIFTPGSTGRYKFSCWMGMVTGIIDVVDGTGELSKEQIDSGSVVDENTVGGCGCAGECGGGCGNSDCPFSD